MNLPTRIAALFLLVMAGPAAAQNLLANPEFDTDLSDWSSPAAVPPSWDATDIDDAADSGSARIVNDQAQSDTEEVVLTQCTTVMPGEYRYGGHAFIPQGKAVSGSVVVRILGYGNATDCTGGTFVISGRLASDTGLWSPMSGDLTITDDQLSGAAGSIQFEFALRKTEAGGELHAFVDQASFGQSPLIFADRFESP